MDGSPILDIKPYLPSFDRIEKVKVPAWVGHDASFRTVSFSEESLQQLRDLSEHFRFYKNAEEMEMVLREVLSADVSKRSDRRLSEFEFDCLSVLFSAKEGAIHVERILLTTEYEKMKANGINLLL